MSNIDISVNKAYVYDAVDEAAAYIGAKAVGDEGAYERIFTTDADRTLLENFWSEACCLATEKLKPFIVEVSNSDVSHSVNLESNYNVTLKMSTLFDSSLTNNINTSLFHFFSNFIVSKWCMLASKADAEVYALESEKMMNEVMRCVYHRKRPQKPTDNESTGATN